MSTVREKHEVSFETFDLLVELDDDGNCRIFFGLGGKNLLAMEWDDLREVIDFVARHGLGMAVPELVESS